jgi:hypothetical protein
MTRPLRVVHFSDLDGELPALGCPDCSQERRFMNYGSSPVDYCAICGCASFVSDGRRRRANVPDKTQGELRALARRLGLLDDDVGNRAPYTREGGTT